MIVREKYTEYSGKLLLYVFEQLFTDLYEVQSVVILGLQCRFGGNSARSIYVGVYGEVKSTNAALIIALDPDHDPKDKGWN